MIKAWFDGSCEPFNPGGHGAYGYVIEKDGRIIHKGGAYLGAGNHMSSNVAEHAGARQVVRFLIEHGLAGEQVEIRGDSILVINQCSGVWRSKAGLYLTVFKETVLMLPRLLNTKWIWVPREQNTLADYLSKKFGPNARRRRHNHWKQKPKGKRHPLNDYQRAAVGNAKLDAGFRLAMRNSP